MHRNIVNFQIYSNLKTLCRNYSSLNATKSQILKSNTTMYTQMKTALKGGPGYTKFGHGRHNLKFSKYAYFWYTFIVSGLVFSLFYDPEQQFNKGKDPDDKIEELKNWYSRTSVPKPK